MKKMNVLREKRIKNEYGVEYVYQLKEEYNETDSGLKYNNEYAVSSYCYVDGHCSGGYYRSYKRLANALKDSYVEKYLKEEI